MNRATSIMKCERFSDARNVVAERARVSTYRVCIRPCHRFARNVSPRFELLSAHVVHVPVYVYCEKPIPWQVNAARVALANGKAAKRWLFGVEKVALHRRE